MSIGLEVLDVRGQEQIAAVVERLQVKIENLLGEGIVQLEALVMAAGEQRRDPLAGGGMLLFSYNFV